MTKELLSALAIGLTFYAFLPYIGSILQGKTKPHFFSWLIWGITTFVVFFAQLAGQAGVGAWPVGISGIITLGIAALAWIKRTDREFTRSDRAFLAAALSALPIWFFTSDPLWAVVTLTTVDLLGFGPTVRKAVHDPHSENIGFFFLFAVRNALVILALEVYSLTTVLFPAAVGGACLLLITLLMWRRRQDPFD